MSLVLSILRFLCKSIFTHLINVEGFRKFESEVKACNLMCIIWVSFWCLLTLLSATGYTGHTVVQHSLQMYCFHGL